MFHTLTRFLHAISCVMLLRRRSFTAYKMPSEIEISFTIQSSYFRIKYHITPDLRMIFIFFVVAANFLQVSGGSGADQPLPETVFHLEVTIHQLRFNGAIILKPIEFYLHGIDKRVDKNGILVQLGDAKKFGRNEGTLNGKVELKYNMHDLNQYSVLILTACLHDATSVHEDAEIKQTNDGYCGNYQIWDNDFMKLPHPASMNIRKWDVNQRREPIAKLDSKIDNILGSN
ncbi:hypothetical protein Ddc_02437 [Ditylenchus destructor]|nr:hypothetical protein Ddc_02437 [Ditylenchus destructor]